jgi:large subunit ribosomal protein L13
MSSVKRKKHELDATNQSPGRLATKIAVLLMGKHKVSFENYKDEGDKVVVLHADKIHFTGKKLQQKEYKHHTMHPGGLKVVPAKKMKTEKPEDIIRLAVIKMLPKNKLRSGRMQRLSFK